MAFMRTRTKPLLVGSLLIVIGALGGGTLVAAWSLRASKLYLQMTRFSFALEQETAAGEAWRRADVQAALGHTACQVEADKEEGAFDPSRSRWHYWFPLYGAVISKQARWGAAKETTVEAMAHVQLAEMWRRLGREEEAEREYKEAKRITGLQDITKLQQAVLEHLDQKTPGSP